MNMKKKFIFIIICIGVSFTLNIGNVIAENVIDGVGGYSVESCNAIGGIATICGIPAGLALMIHDIYNLLKICVPIVLIIMGMIDLLKGVASQKEDEIKRAQGSFLKKLIVAAIVFLTFSIVRLVFNFANSGNNAGESKSIWNCVDGIINADCSTIEK